MQSGYSLNGWLWVFLNHPKSFDQKKIDLTTTLIHLQQVHLHPPSGFSWALPLGAALLRLVAVPEGLIANLRNLEKKRVFWSVDSCDLKNGNINLLKKTYNIEICWRFWGIHEFLRDAHMNHTSLLLKFVFFFLNLSCFRLAVLGLKSWDIPDATL